MKKLIILFSITLSILFSVEVILKNGQVYNGEIISQNSEQLILKTEFGELKFPNDSIESISYTDKQEDRPAEIPIIELEKKIIDRRTQIKNEFQELGCNFSHSSRDTDFYECKISSNSKKIFTVPDEYILFKSKNDDDKIIKENSSTYTEISLGFTMSDIYGDDIDSEYEVAMDNGYKIGILNNNNQIIFGFSYDVRKYKMSANIDGFELKGTNQLNFINIDFMSKVGEKGYKPVILIGGRGSFFFSGEGKAEVCYSGYCDSETNDIDEDDIDSEFDYGVLGGLYIPLSEKMSLKISGYLGLFKMWDDDSDIKNRSLEATLQFKL